MPVAAYVLEGASVGRGADLFEGVDVHRRVEVAVDSMEKAKSQGVLILAHAFGAAGVHPGEVAAEEGDGVAGDANIRLDARELSNSWFSCVSSRSVMSRLIARLVQDEVRAPAIALSLEEDHLLQP